MKLAAVTNRGSKKDFFDIYFLLEMYSLAELLRFFQEKFQDWNVFMVIQSLGYFEDAESTETPRVLQGNVSWSRVKNTITETLKKHA